MSSRCLDGGDCELWFTLGSNGTVENTLGCPAVVLSTPLGGGGAEALLVTATLSLQDVRQTFDLEPIGGSPLATSTQWGSLISGSCIPKWAHFDGRWSHICGATITFEVTCSIRCADAEPARRLRGLVGLGSLLGRGGNSSAGPPSREELLLSGLTGCATTGGVEARKLAGSVAVNLFDAEASGAPGVPAGQVHVQYIFALGCDGGPVGPRSSSALNAAPPRTLLMGHRGSGADNAARVQGTGHRRSHFIENTLLSMCAASAAEADCVEFDVQLTRDWVPVIHHDWGVVCTSPFDGACQLRVPVGHLTLRQFKALRPQVMDNGPAMNETGAAHSADQGAARSVDQSAAAVSAIAAVPSTRVAPPPPRTGLASAKSDARTLDALGLDAPRLPPSPAPAPPFCEKLSDHEFCTLAEALNRVPRRTGFNIEVKYPTDEEARMFGLRHVERNAMVDQILECVATHAQGRWLMFSSFDPDVCLLLARKQTTFPVLFLTEGGTQTDPPHYPDPRWNSLDAAVEWASAAALDGVVTEVSPLLADPTRIAAIAGKGLKLASYGRRNNDPAVTRMQQEAGMFAVILDHVAHERRARRGDACL